MALEQYFPELTVHTNLPESCDKAASGSIGVGWSLRFCISDKNMWYVLNCLSLKDIMKKSEGCTEKEKATNVAWHGYVELAIDLPGFLIFSLGNSWILFSKILIKTKSTFPICTVVAFLQKALCSCVKQVQFSDNYGQMFHL